jgi:hypothetical protein
MLSCDLSPEKLNLNSLAREIADEIARDPNAITTEALGTLMSALVRAYGTKFDEGERALPIDPQNAPNATNVLVTVSALMKASGLEIFELGMWQSWSGTR